MLPVPPRYLCGAQCAGKYRELHPDLVFETVLRLSVNLGEDRCIRSGFNPFRQPLGAGGISLDVKMGIVDRIVFIRAGSYFAKRLGIEHLTPPEGGLECFAPSHASVKARHAYPRHGDNILYSVEAAGCVTGIGLSKVCHNHLSYTDFC